MKTANLDKIQTAINSQQSKELKKMSKGEEAKEKTVILVETLWEKLSAMYGYKFLSQFGEEPDRTWETCLKGITARQMADGLNNCLDYHPEWPPGAAQFRAMCLGQFLDDEGNDSSWQHSGAAYKLYKPETLIESDDKKSKCERVGNSALADMKAMFKGVI